MSIWFYIGIGLTLWLLWDLFTGVVWSYRPISKKQEPEQYWFFMFVWAIAAFSTLYFGYYNF